MIKFGKLTHPVDDIIKDIEFAKKNNFDYVEIGIESMNNAGEIKKKKLKIKKLLKNFSYKTIGHTTWWYDLSSLYDVVRNAWIKQGEEDIKISNEIDIEYLNFHFMVLSIALLQNKKSRKLILDNYVKSLSYLCSYASKRKVKIMLENGEEKFEYYKYVLDRVPKLYVHLDIGHAFISGRMKNIKKFLSYFSNRIAHIHIHDNHGKNDEHLALRKGKINWKAVVSVLKKSKYDKSVTFEVFKSEKDLLKSREYFKKLWHNLK